MSASLTYEIEMCKKMLHTVQGAIERLMSAEYGGDQLEIDLKDYLPVLRSKIADLLGHSDSGVSEVASFLEEAHRDVARISQSLREWQRFSGQFPTNSITWLLDQFKQLKKMCWQNIPSVDAEPQLGASSQSTRTVFRHIHQKLRTLYVRSFREDRVFEIILERVQRVAERKQSVPNFDRRALLYKLELTDGLAAIKQTSEEHFFTGLEQFLIYMNYNSKRFMDMLVQRIYKVVTAQETASGSYWCVRTLQREFQQLHRKPDRILNPNYRSVDKYVNDWLAKEVKYFKTLAEMESLDGPSVLPRQRLMRSALKEKKLRCNLTVDQLALMFRAMDELKIVESKSLNLVFKSVAPYLATPHAKEISPQSMRSKSYSPEVLIKQTTVDVLHRVIRKIDSY